LQVKTYAGYEAALLESMDAFWTVREIFQQPDSWRRTAERLCTDRERIENFLAPILARTDCRIVLTGAGTSAFAGTTLAPALSRLLGRHVEAIATTDLVTGPDQHFRRDVPTLLVSFARSGNSPESVAAVELARGCIDECFQLVLSCNADGALYRLCERDPASLALLMPEETNDRAFAMTSSFTSMLFAAIAVFTGIEAFTARADRLASVVERLIETGNDEIKALAELNCSRVMYLGSNEMKGLAQEASLKLLELTDGQVLAAHESSLGVRHGPKTILNPDTLVILFMSADAYTRKYDADILNELVKDAQVRRIVALTAPVELEQHRPEQFAIAGTEQFTDLELLFPYIVFAQLYGLHHAIKVGNRPDNPSASGTVNRVVQGVRIHANRG
jgi:tagatose-6-phosphate ketose/aldose isomerase